MMTPIRFSKITIASEVFYVYNLKWFLKLKKVTQLQVESRAFEV
jgi:hypothetical protein